LGLRFGSLQALDIAGYCLLLNIHLQPGGGQSGQMLRGLSTNQVIATTAVIDQSGESK
jgi:hypothetical protein